MKEFPSNGAKLNDYEAFIAIVDTGNLTQAAARLRRSLQSVSRSLAALEAHLGVVLIRRTTRTARPTEAGLAFHRRASAAFREIALAEAELGDTSGKLSGTLCVAGSAFFVSHHVVPTIRDFSSQHPGVKFDLRISEQFAEPIRAGVDLMIRIGQLPPSPMKSRKIASLRRVAIASPSYLAQRGRDDARRAGGYRHRGDAFLLRTPIRRDRARGGRARGLRLAPTPAHAVWPSGARTPSRVRRFVDLLAQRLKKKVI